MSMKCCLKNVPCKSIVARDVFLFATKVVPVWFSPSLDKRDLDYRCEFGRSSLHSFMICKFFFRRLEAAGVAIYLLLRAYSLAQPNCFFTI